jgi:hypothetical protein
MTQTDDLLSKLYDQLRNTGDSFSMVYFSDHGLAFKERGKEVQYLAHDDKFQQNFQVPFMVLSSDDKTHRVIKARRSANDFLQFFSQWTGITAEQIKTAYPFVSNKKAPPVYVTNFKLQKVDYNHLGTDIFDIKSKFVVLMPSPWPSPPTQNGKTKKSATLGGFFIITGVIRSGNLRPRSRCQRQRCGYGSAHRRSPEQRFRLG